MATLYPSGAERPVGAAPSGSSARSAWRPVLLSWIFLAAALIALKAPQIAAMQFGDPDDALRLVQVRDLLGGQSWFDLHQYRVAAPEGVAMHWSRLVDVPIAAMILLLRPLLGSHGAELSALVAVPLLTLLCALTLVGRLALRYFDREVALLACLSFALAIPVMWQFTPLRIDHHAWQIVLALAALTGLHAAKARTGGRVIGLALAVSLSISIEGLPLAAVFLAVCGLRDLRAPAARFAWLREATAALAAGSLVLFVATRGIADLASHCDQVSPVHLAMFAWTAAGVAVLHQATPRRAMISLAGLGLIGAGALTILLGAAPQCRGGGFAALDPLVLRFWLPSVAEGMPFWHARPHLAAVIVAGPLIGLYGAWRLWREAEPAAQRAVWGDHLLVLAGAWLIGMMVARASATALVFAAVPAAAQVACWIEKLRKASFVRRLAGYTGMAALLVPGIPVAVAASLVAPSHDSAQTGAASCHFDQAAAALDRLAPTDILVPLDMGPDILVRTHQRVVATGHHRGSAAMHDVIAAFLAPAPQARAIMQARHATMVMICPAVSRHSVYAQAAPDGLMARLVANRPPEWLAPVDLAPGSGLQFWRVVQ
ncbi:hypothetical protein [Novosphingobium sp.]|uniref:hypothetical protein n=1 Tax=Novosphingobium sp. TaxID=1874826 RepID=UPI003BAC4693